MRCVPCVRWVNRAGIIVSTRVMERVRGGGGVEKGGGGFNGEEKG